MLASVKQSIETVDERVRHADRRERAREIARTDTEGPIRFRNEPVTTRTRGGHAREHTGFCRLAVPG